MTVSPHVRWTAGAVSAALNGLLILAVAQMGAGARPRVWVEDPALQVSLVSVRGAETAAPAPSAQAQPPPSEPAPRPLSALDVSRRSTPEPLAAPTPLYAADAPSTAGATATTTEAPSRPAAPSPPQRVGTREGLDIAAPNGASTDYASRLRAWLEAHKTYPRRARMRREEGVVQIHFAVDRQGRLLAGDVTRSSGHTTLDAEAMAMLSRADPFPSAPHGVRGERIEISTPVEFSLQR